MNGKVLPRTAQSFGILIHDTLGNERGGFGWLSNGKAVISLDRPNQDAWAAIVDDKTGFAGTVNLFSPDVASRNTTGVLIGTQGKKAFVHVKDTNDKDRAVLDVEGDALPTLKALDGSGGAGQDIFSKSH